MRISLENVHAENRETVIALLEQAQLLTDDLPADLSTFVLAKGADGYVGVAGLERLGTVALLRSVAVEGRYQGQQIGALLVGSLLESAKTAGLNEVFLITTTADRYFERHGFQPVDRQEVPIPIQQTQQFSALCPASAVVMKRVINQS